MKVETNTDISELIGSTKLFFRAIRMPASQNPYSLHKETFLETEIRKIKRKRGEPTLTKLNGEKDGNPNRSFTMMLPNQRVFGNVGYAIISPEIGEIKDVITNMDERPTGYGKRAQLERVNKGYSNKEFDKIISKIESNRFDYETRTDKVNEIIIDVKSPQKISFIYFQEDNIRPIETREGIETLNTDIIKLDAIYTAMKFERLCGAKLPIFCYSKEKNTLKRFDYDEKDIINFTKTLTKTTYRIDLNARMDLIKEFRGILEKDEKLYLGIKKYLDVSSSYVMANTNFFKEQYYKTYFGSFINRTLTEIKNMISFAETLKEYGNQEKTNEVGETTLRKLLMNYSSDFSGITRVKNGCTHSDIPIRTFIEAVDAVREVIYQKEFAKFVPSIQDTFTRIVLKNDNYSSKLTDEIIQRYCNNRDYLSGAMEKVLKEREVKRNIQKDNSWGSFFKRFISCTNTKTL